MEIVVTKENLFGALQLLQRVSGVNRELPALSSVNLKTSHHRLQLEATDLEIGLTTSIGAKVIAEGGIAVPMRLLFDFVSLVSDETVRLKAIDTMLTINSQASVVKIRGVASSEFPVIPTVVDGKIAQVPGPLLAIALQTVLLASSSDSSRPILQSIACIGGKELKLVATDSFRLAEVSLPVAWELPQLILPLRAAQELVKLARSSEEVVVAIQDQQIEFSTATTRLVSRTLDGSYPEYTKIIPSEVPSVIEVNRAELISAIKLAGVFTRSESQSVELSYADNQLVVAGVSHLLGEGAVTLPATLHGAVTSLSATYNAKYLLDGMLPQTTEVVQLGLVAADRPLVLRAQLAQELQFLYLVMPLQSPVKAALPPEEAVVR